MKEINKQERLKFIRRMGNTDRDNLVFHLPEEKEREQNKQDTKQ